MKRKMQMRILIRGHLQTMICMLNVIVRLRGWGGLGRDVNNFILMQQNGNEVKNKWSSNMFAIHFVSKLLYFALAFGT